MSVLAQRRVMSALESAGIINDTRDFDPVAVMEALGAVAERAVMPRQHLNEREDRRLAHADLPSMSDRDLWREEERIKFVAAWGDDRTGWIWERINAIGAERKRRKASNAR
jgi:hypothetical protein